jgi:hypothetical protein
VDESGQKRKGRIIMRDAETISRRALLGGAASAVGAAATIRASRRAAAQQKVSQADAKYQDQPKEQQRCEICLNFQPPERVPVRREPDQSERLVSVLCGEGKRALTLAQKPRRNSSSFAECVNLAFLGERLCPQDRRRPHIRP